MKGSVSSGRRGCGKEREDPSPRAACPFLSKLRYLVEVR